MTESNFEQVEELAQALRREISRPLTEESRRAYYQHMPLELQKQWDTLTPEEQDTILKILEEYHQMMEHELWHLLSGLIEVLIRRN